MECFQIFEVYKPQHVLVRECCGKKNDMKLNLYVTKFEGKYKMMCNV